MTLYITEHTGPAVINGSPVPVGTEPPLATYTLKPDITPVKGPNFNRTSTLIRINVDPNQPVHIAFGKDATEDDRRLSPQATEFFNVPQRSYLSVLAATY